MKNNYKIFVITVFLLLLITSICGRKNSSVTQVFDEEPDIYTNEIAVNKYYTSEEYKAQLIKNEEKGQYPEIKDIMLSYYETVIPLIVSNEKENTVISPVCTYNALSMLTDISSGNSQKELLSILNAKSLEELRQRNNQIKIENSIENEKTLVTFSNSLWLRNDDLFEYSKDKQNDLENEYKSEIFSGDVSSEEYNNKATQWISEKTNGILNESMSVKNQKHFTDTSIINLISATYYKGQWTEKMTALSEKESFKNGEKETACNYMTDTTSTLYYSNNYVATKKSFSDGFAMWFVLPDEGTKISEVLDNSTGLYNQILSQYQNTSKSNTNIVNADIILKVPKFDISYNADLTEYLKSCGIESVFDEEKADLTLLATSKNNNKNAFVSKVMTLTKMKIDENGAEAASYTEIMGTFATLNTEPITKIYLTLNRPFVYILTGPSGDILYIGVINDPTKTN